MSFRTRLRDERMRRHKQAGNKKPAHPGSGERVVSLGHFVAAFVSDRILALGEWHLGCPSQVAGPSFGGPLLMSLIQ